MKEDRATKEKKTKENKMAKVDKIAEDMAVKNLSTTIEKI